MTRAFLYGVGWFATVGTIQQWILLGTNQQFVQSGYAGFAVVDSVILAVIAIVFFQLAKRSKPNRSYLRAVFDLILGFTGGYMLAIGVFAVAFSLI